MNKLIASAAVTASVVGGGLVGAAALGGTALAQDDQDPADGTETPESGPRGQRFEELATTLGTDVETLREALRDDQTLADIAAANGVPVQDVVDTIVANMTERIAQALSDGRITEDEAAEKTAGAEERANDIVNGDAPLGRRGPGGRGFGGGNLDQLAETLGTDADSLRDALQDGQSIADVAEANGADVQAVIDSMIARAEERLAQAVADDRITEEEAADKAAQIAERAEDVVNGDAPLGRRGPRGRFGPPPGAELDDGAPEVQGSVFTVPA